MILETQRLTLRQIDKTDSIPYLQYLIDNKEFLEEWEPKREDSDYSIEKIENQIDKEIAKSQNKNGYLYLIIPKNTDEIIGTIKIWNIVYGPFMSCNIGYKLSKAHINKGYMTEAIIEIKKYCFTDLGLHRIEVSIMPKNVRSQKVIQKAGFSFEGTSKKYVKINGVWEDHDNYVIINEI
jgi:ribosomal-protein-alanine N-acetyltransferase